MSPHFSIFMWKIPHKNFCKQSSQYGHTTIFLTGRIEACRRALSRREILQPPNENLVPLIRTVLGVNKFNFQSENYVQIHGTVMGTRMTPSYANLFLGHLEDRIVAEVENKPFVLWQFVDDIFAIWPHSKVNLQIFVHKINNEYTIIKFTAEWLYRSMQFLDVPLPCRMGN